jgi:hypothetical protein
METNWLQLAYQYLIGGFFFTVTTYLCFKLGAGNLKNSSDRKVLIYLVFGFVGYLAMHTIWIILASR